MKFVGSIKNGLALEKKLKKFQAECLDGQVKAMQEAVFLVHKTAVELVQDNGSGVPQVRYTNGRKRTVLASRPGEPPNTDTGRLAQSIKFDFRDQGLTGRVGTNLNYGAWLEFGTKNTAARPWLSTALEIVSKEIATIFAKHVNKSIKESEK